MPDALVFVEDPGAANYVVGLPERLAAMGLSAALYVTGHAVAYLRANGQAITELPAGATAPDLLDATGARAVLVGTAVNPDTLGLALIDEARRRSLPSLAVVDDSANAEHRFRGRTDHALAHAPDRIVVSDAWTMRLYRDLGVPAERLAVCGHPRYEAVLARARELEDRGRDDVRARVLGDTGGRKALLFCTEISLGLNPAQYLHSAEYTLHGRGKVRDRMRIVLEEFLDAVASLPQRPYLALKLHPKNTREEFAAYEAECDALLQGGDSLEALFAADGAVGLASTILTEGCIMGRPVLSVLPRERERAWLPGGPSGPIHCVTDRGGLRRWLAAWLDDGLPHAGAGIEVLEDSLGRVAHEVAEAMGKPMKTPRQERRT